MEQNVSSSSGFTQESAKLLPDGAAWTFGIAMAVLFLISLLENSVILYVIGVNKKLRTCINFWIITIIIFDFSITLLSFPPVIVSSFAKKWVFGRLGCKLYGFVVTFLGVGSIYLLTALSVHRYLVVVRNTLAKRISGVHVGLGVTACMLFALIWAVAPFLGWGSYALEGYGISCAPDWRTNNVLHKTYVMSLIIGVLFTTLTVLLVSYGGILFKLRSAGRRQSSFNSHRRMRKEVRVTVSVALTVGCFLLAWSPYAIVSLCSTFFDIDVFEISPMLLQLPCLMAKTACAWNPLVYVFHNSDFRKCILHLFSVWRTRLTQQGSTLHDLSRSQGSSSSDPGNRRPQRASPIDAD